MVYANLHLTEMGVNHSNNDAKIFFGSMAMKNKDPLDQWIEVKWEQPPVQNMTNQMKPSEFGVFLMQSLLESLDISFPSILKRSL